MSQPQFVPSLYWAHRVTIFHLFFVGWVTHMIFGVAYWMFPTQSRENPRGSVWPGVVTLCLLNVGILLRALVEPLQYTTLWRPSWSLFLVTAGLLQWLAALCFSAYIWRRIRGKRTGKKKHATS